MSFIKLLALWVIVTALLSSCGQSKNDEGENGSNQLGRELSVDQAAGYTCPMHPHYISTDPNGSCLICGMDLVAARGSEEGAQDDQGLGSNVSVATTITVDTGVTQAMGVRVGTATLTELSGTLGLFGVVEPNQRLETVSVARIEGWIDKLFIRAEGEKVSKGQMLYRVYSPGALSAQKDYLNALKLGERQRILAVEQRLISMGMQQESLSSIKKNRKLIPSFVVYAESDGVVVSLSAREGAYIKPGSPIVRLQSYDSVWVIASVPETDLPFVNIGSAAKMSFRSLPGVTLESRVDYIYPAMDTSTRTARVRFVVPNHQGELLVGAYASVNLEFGRGRHLSVPTEAILHDSLGHRVISALGNGRFQSRMISIGMSSDGRTEVISGIEEGEEIVVSGQFMLDSEINLREGLSRFAPSVDKQAEKNGEYNTPLNNKLVPLSEVNLDTSTLTQFDHFVDAALYLHKSLSTNEAINPNFIDPAIRLADALEPRFSGTELVMVLEQSKHALEAAQQAQSNMALAQALDELMSTLVPWLLTGTPQHYRDLGLYLYLDIDSNRHWLQQKGEPKNPYGSTRWQLISWPIRPSEIDTVEPVNLTPKIME